jgi:hypothetical protein
VNELQRAALQSLCDLYHVEFNESDFRYAFGLPEGYVAGQVGPIYVGCVSDGQISS